MNNRLTKFVAIVAFLVIPACTFEDGQPWGQVEFGLDSRAMDTTGRMEGELFKTAADYGLEIESLTVEFAALSAVQTTAAATDFDPASPPPGYSLCHNGHCHSDDGRLVDYADIQAELSGNSATGHVVTQGIDDVADAMRDQSLALDPECTANCEVQRGQIGLMNVATTSVSLKARVFDLSPEGRLPTEGLLVDHTWETPLTMSNAVSVEVGDASPGIGLDTAFQLSPKILDEVEWQSLHDSTEAVISGLNESVIQTKVVRYEL